MGMNRPALRTGGAEGELKITDFGLATQLTEGCPETQRCGSAGYAAPEVLHGLPYNTQADLFSAGVILFKLFGCLMMS